MAIVRDINAGSVEMQGEITARRKWRGKEMKFNEAAEREKAKVRVCKCFLNPVRSGIVAVAAVALLTGGGIAMAQIMPAAPVSGWTFDDGSYDDLFGDNHGTKDDGSDATSRVQFSNDTPLGSGQSVEFIHSGEGVVNIGQPPDLMALRSEFSVALWMKPTSDVNNWAYMLSRYDVPNDKRSWAVVNRPPNDNWAMLNSGDGDTNSNRISDFWGAREGGIQLDTWHHLVATFSVSEDDRLTIRMYENGSHIRTVCEAWGEVYDAPVDIVIGGRSDRSGENGFIGLLDEVAIWDYELSLDEIMWLSGNSLSEIAEGDRVITDNLTVTTCFDSGGGAGITVSRLDTGAEGGGGSKLEIELTDAQGYGPKGYFHFRIDDGAGQTVHIEFTNLVSSRMTEDHHLLYTTDLENLDWQTMDEPIGDILEFEVPADRVYISNYHAYPYRNIVQRVNDLIEHPLVEAEVIGQSHEGRNIYALRIAEHGVDPDEAYDYVMLARQHPGEVQGSWHLDAAVDYILEVYDDPFTGFDNDYVFHVIPVANPDGVYHGIHRFCTQGHDFNRRWDRETPVEIGYMKDYMRGNLRDVYWGLDFHSSTNQPFEYPAIWYDERAVNDDDLEIIEALVGVSKSFDSSSSSTSNSRVRGFIYQEFGGVMVTTEVSTYWPHTPESLHEEGRGFIKATLSLVGPAPPESLTYPSSSTTGEYSVEWSSAEGAATYVLERSSSGGDWEEVYQGPATSYEEEAGNGAYRYRVRALDDEQAKGSWKTGEHECIVWTTAELPATPADIIYPELSLSGFYTVAWTEADEALTYRLERSSNGGDNWAMVSEGYTTSYDESVNMGEYVYRVRAQNPAGNSDWRTGHELLVILSEIEAWRRQNFDEQFWGDPEVSGLMADPNNDGFSNLVNYALRGDPNQNDAPLMAPRTAIHAQFDEPTYSFRVRRVDGSFDADTGGYLAGGVIYVVKTSDEPGDDAVLNRMALTEDNTILEDGEDGPMLHELIGEEFRGDKGFARLVIIADD